MPAIVTFTPHLPPVELPTTTEMDENIDVVVMGNGRTTHSPSSTELQYAILKTLPYETCRLNFPHLPRLSRKPCICAIDQENAGQSKASICSGDSGSPMLRMDGSLLGIASFVGGKL